MMEYKQFYINGKWVDPVSSKLGSVINPYTEQVIAQVSLGNSKDLDLAVAAARNAFPSFSATSVAERYELIEAILIEYEKRAKDIAELLPIEMGAPAWLAQRAQVPVAVNHFKQILKVLKSFEFKQVNRSTAYCYEPIGVVGMITPWNWPLNQIACKVAPALAAGCTMVLKPSESAPLNALIMAEVIDSAGVPAGVFNLVNGTGTEVGEPMSAHKDIDMVSFTGSTRAGIRVAEVAAATVKRVAQELGGKSPFIVLDDADLENAVKQAVQGCFLNAGQSCNAPTRLLVPQSKHDEAIKIALEAAQKVKIAHTPDSERFTMGPVSNKVQFERVQLLIQQGIDEGADLIIGGVGRPDNLECGYFVKPTVFGNVKNNMTIAQEEIFGPVLCVLPYDSTEEAIEIANDSCYGLSGYVHSGDLNKAKQVAAQLRTGMVHLNGAPQDISAPFGGYKKSGNGKEWGLHGLIEFLEIKSVMGYEPS